MTPPHYEIISSQTTEFNAPEKGTWGTGGITWGRDATRPVTNHCCLLSAGVAAVGFKYT